MKVYVVTRDDDVDGYVYTRVLKVFSNKDNAFKYADEYIPPSNDVDADEFFGTEVQEFDLED